MNDALAREIMDAGQAAGASLTELFEEETREARVSLRDSRVESATSAIRYGIGLRLIFGTQVAYGFTSRDDADSLRRLLRDLLAAFSVSGTHQPLVQLPVRRHSSATPVQKLPAMAGPAAKLAFLKLADQAARTTDARISQVSVSAYDAASNIRIWNSDGIFAEDQRIRARFSVSATAESGSERFTASENPGAMAGFEFFETLPIEKLAQTAAQRAALMITSGYAPARRMPVILGNGFGGVIFHEACGHPLETDAIRRNASPFAGRMGEQIAHPSVTAIDDGTIPGSWGSIAVDDEGNAPEKTVLIENGILKNFLADRVGASDTGVRPTGSARRESYEYAPVSRMRNTYIAAGTDSLDSMLASVDTGLYALKMGGGSVNPATGEFNFAVEEGYMIRNGRVAEPVRGATLIGLGHEILPRISMVGHDLEITAGMCGAASGSVPVTVGQPTIKVDEILVGGRDAS